MHMMDITEIWTIIWSKDVISSKDVKFISYIYIKTFLWNWFRKAIQQKWLKTWL